MLSIEHNLAYVKYVIQYQNKPPPQNKPILVNSKEHRNGMTGCIFVVVCILFQIQTYNTTFTLPTRKRPRHIIEQPLSSQNLKGDGVKSKKYEIEGNVSVNEQIVPLKVNIDSWAVYAIKITLYTPI